MTRGGCRGGRQGPGGSGAPRRAPLLPATAESARPKQSGQRGRWAAAVHAVPQGCKYSGAAVAVQVQQKVGYRVLVLRRKAGCNSAGRAAQPRSAPPARQAGGCKQQKSHRPEQQHRRAAGARRDHLRMSMTTAWQPMERSSPSESTFSWVLALMLMTLGCALSMPHRFLRMFSCQVNTGCGRTGSEHGA